MSTDTSHHRKLAKSAGIIGGLTGISRVLGFVRDLVIAAAFGTGIYAEAFVVCFKLPNLLRDLVGEGATNAAFVPVLTECHEKKKAEFWGLVSTLFYVMTTVLLILTVLGIVFAPFVVHLMAPGFADDPEKLPLTIKLTRVIFPYILFIGLSALAMGVLNSLKEFSSSAFGPILLNICMIVSGVFFEKTYGPMALVVGVLVGGVLQLAWQVPPLVRAGFHLEKPTIGHDAAKKIGKLLIPRAFGSALYQINIFVDSILASFSNIVGPGGQSALYYSNRLFQLPLAIFGVSVAQALLPTFSTQFVRSDLKGFKHTFSLAIESVMLLVIPASVGLLVMAHPIVHIVFERGRFDSYSTMITSSALFYYSLGLLSCCLVKMLVNAFYAMQDTRTPLKITFMGVALNIVLSLLFMQQLKIGGLALASTISATFNVAWLYLNFRRRVGPLEEAKILAAFVKIALAAVLMAVFALGFSRRFVSGPVSLALGIFLSITVYFGAAYLLKIEGLRKILSWRQRSSPTT